MKGRRFISHLYYLDLLKNYKPSVILNDVVNKIKKPARKHLNRLNGTGGAKLNIRNKK